MSCNTHFLPAPPPASRSVVGSASTAAPEAAPASAPASVAASEAASAYAPASVAASVAASAPASVRVWRSISHLTIGWLLLLARCLGRRRFSPNSRRARTSAPGTGGICLPRRARALHGLVDRPLHDRRRRRRRPRLPRRQPGPQHEVQGQRRASDLAYGLDAVAREAENDAQQLMAAAARRRPSDETPDSGAIEQYDRLALQCQDSSLLLDEEADRDASGQKAVGGRLRAIDRGQAPSHGQDATRSPAIRLTIIEPTPEELAAHEAMLEKIRKSGACVWDFD